MSLEVGKKALDFLHLVDCPHVGDQSQPFGFAYPFGMLVEHRVAVVNARVSRFLGLGRRQVALQEGNSRAPGSFSKSRSTRLLRLKTAAWKRC